MKKLFFIKILLLIITVNIYSQNEIPLPKQLPVEHPRFKNKYNDHEKLKNDLIRHLEFYVEKTEKEPDWLSSRLMMYWKSKASNIYIDGGVYSHADGEAPVPTVRFGSTRGVSSNIKRPKIEDIIPYMDDTKGVFFHNNAKEGNPLEWAEQKSVNSSHIESVNEEIMRIAKNAAVLYWLTNEEKYAKLAFGVLDTYLMGAYYRDEPIDLGNGHAQTLVGLSTFEVIQERILIELAFTYDFLHSYLEENYPEKIENYTTALKKWIDISLKNGVPHNNWNLHKSRFALNVAMILEDNSAYTDNKGREYYIGYILNRTTARHWSLDKFINYGYDFETGIWNECPGYAQNVSRDLISFFTEYNNIFNQNLLEYFPVLEAATQAIPQYLFPNQQITAFGDTYYGNINSTIFKDVAQLWRNSGNQVKSEFYQDLYDLFAKNNSDKSQNNRLKKENFITQTFYAPNVSWFVQRNKYDDKQNGLMISKYGSYGNHAHANGVAIELYGKGYILGAESGIGSSYFEKPYLEYYSQFPAHNTVMVDGISKYPEMLSNHPFDLLSCYPEPGKKDGYFKDITYSDVYFLEPESRSDQNRLTSIISTGETTGYYVDIFRSKKQQGGEKFHDYFYHNLGQELFIQNINGKNLELTESDEMGFAGGHLFALDYMWDKKSIKTNEDYKAIWKMSYPDGNHIYMNLWMKGYEGREIFSIKAPPCKAFRNNNDFPYEVNNSPYLTIAARQHGEAWNKPFVSIFEPTTEAEGSSIGSIQYFSPDNKSKISSDFVGIIVENKSGRVDYLFSIIEDEIVSYKDMKTDATYAVISEQGDDFTLFMGKGLLISNNKIKIEATCRANTILEYKNGKYYLTTDKPITIVTLKGKIKKFDSTDNKEILI